MTSKETWVVETLDGLLIGHVVSEAAAKDLIWRCKLSKRFRYTEFRWFKR